MKDMESRRDSSRTRQRILDVARSAFTHHGYEATTVRGIAVDAGVAANLITRYFGGKAGLYRQATALELGVDVALPGPFETLGRRLADRVVRRWESQSTEDPLQMMLRSATSSEAAAVAFGSFLAEQAAFPLIDHLRAELGISRREAADRAAAVNALVMGVAMSRHVTRAGPIGAAGPRALRRWMGDALQRLLDGPQLPALGSLGTWAKPSAPKLTPRDFDGSDDSGP